MTIPVVAQHQWERDLVEARRAMFDAPARPRLWDVLKPKNGEELMLLCQRLEGSQVLPAWWRKAGPELLELVLLTLSELGVRDLIGALRSCAWNQELGVYLYGDLPLAVLSARRDLVGHEESFDPQAGTATCKLVRAYEMGDRQVEEVFSIEEAKRLGLWSNSVLKDAAGTVTPWLFEWRQQLVRWARVRAAEQLFADVFAGVVLVAAPADLGTLERLIAEQVFPRRPPGDRVVEVPVPSTVREEPRETPNSKSGSPAQPADDREAFVPLTGGPIPVTMPHEGVVVAEVPLTAHPVVPVSRDTEGGVIHQQVFPPRIHKTAKAPVQPGDGEFWVQPASGHVRRSSVRVMPDGMRVVSWNPVTVNAEDFKAARRALEQEMQEETKDWPTGQLGERLSRRFGKGKNKIEDLSMAELAQLLLAAQREPATFPPDVPGEAPQG